jgi:hypothetical protein
MRYFSGYMTKPGRKTNFEVMAASKKNALRNLKEDNPSYDKIVITESYKRRPKVDLRGIHR